MCNNQLLELVENELIWVLGLIPGFSSVLPNMVAKLHMIQGKYLSPPVPSPAMSDKMVGHLQTLGIVFSDSFILMITLGFMIAFFFCPNSVLCR